MDKESQSNNSEKNCIENNVLLNLKSCSLLDESSNSAKKYRCFSQKCLNYLSKSKKCILAVILFFVFRSEGVETHELNQTYDIREETHQKQKIYWYDGNKTRELRLSDEWIAAFKNTRTFFLEKALGESTLLYNEQRIFTASKLSVEQYAYKESSLSSKNNSESLEKKSPVFLDEYGQLKALPGGVIVKIFKKDIPEVEKLFEKLQLRPMRSISSKNDIWFIGADPGTPSLELANQLHESGLFESVSPNWWSPKNLL